MGTWPPRYVHFALQLTSSMVQGTYVVATPTPGATRPLSKPPSSVAIVMMDSRRPEMKMGLTRYNKQEMTTQAQGRLLTLFTYYLNFKYACRHGYKLLFYKLAGTDCDGKRCVAGCAHPIWGGRHPSYCKLSAIAAALAEGYETVAYIDSDAFFQNTTRLPDLLSTYDASSLATQTRIEPHAFFAWDWPFTLGPNMGFIVLRNTDIGRELLRVRRFTVTTCMSGQRSHACCSALRCGGTCTLETLGSDILLSSAL